MEKIRAFPLLGLALMMLCPWTAFAATNRATGPGQAAGARSPAQFLQEQRFTSQNAAQPTVARRAQCSMMRRTTSSCFSKNADTQYYPASITKLMTALLVAENCNLSDTVTFFQTAVSNLESGSSTLQVKAGDTLRLRTVSMVCF